MKSLNTRAKLTIQKLYEAMYNKPHMIKEGQYAKINNNPAYMPVTIEKVGHLPGYGEIISITHYGTQNGDPMADPDMEFVIICGDYFLALRFISTKQSLTRRFLGKNSRV